MGAAESRAERVARDAAAEMRRQLEHCTPADMGWPALTAEELIASEYQCWLAAEADEELRSYAPA